MNEKKSKKIVPGRRSEEPIELGDLLNIQGTPVPPIDEELDALLRKGKETSQRILDGASTRMFGDRKPYARTEVHIEFQDEENLRRCVRLLRWSDDRLLALGSTIAWSWDASRREGMSIHFAVNWYERDFFESHANAFRDSNHLSYFRMFGKSASDMHVHTEVLGN